MVLIHMINWMKRYPIFCLVIGVLKAHIEAHNLEQGLGVQNKSRKALLA